MAQRDHRPSPWMRRFRLDAPWGMGLVARMRILFIGGTGIISTACTELALARGHEVSLLNRGRRAQPPSGARCIACDINNEAEVGRAIEGRTWDVIVNFVAFTPDDIERDLRLFLHKSGQYIFISSASAYQRPVSHYLITESTPLANPLWAYSRAKIACEDRLLRALRDQAFPAVIVRPSLTFGDSQVALAINSWQKSYTVVDRMRRGEPVIVPGDGTSLWTITHNSDFAKGLVGLFGCTQATGHAFHITSDEVKAWDQYYLDVAAAAGVSRPNLVHSRRTSSPRASPTRPVPSRATRPRALFSTTRKSSGSSPSSLPQPGFTRASREPWRGLTPTPPERSSTTRPTGAGTGSSGHTGVGSTPRFGSSVLRFRNRNFRVGTLIPGASCKVAIRGPYELARKLLKRNPEAPVTGSPPNRRAGASLFCLLARRVEQSGPREPGGAEAIGDPGHHYGPPTSTGLPRREGSSRCSTEAKNASMST